MKKLMASGGAPGQYGRSSRINPGAQRGRGEAQYLQAEEMKILIETKRGDVEHDGADDGRAVPRERRAKRHQAQHYDRENAGRSREVVVKDETAMSSHACRNRGEKKSSQ